MGLMISKETYHNDNQTEITSDVLRISNELSTSKPAITYGSTVMNLLNNVKKDMNKQFMKDYETVSNIVEVNIPYINKAIHLSNVARKMEKLTAKLDLTLDIVNVKNKRVFDKIYDTIDLMEPMSNLPVDIFAFTEKAYDLDAKYRHIKEGIDDFEQNVQSHSW